MFPAELSDTGECLRSAQCVSCVATLAPTHQHWRLCVLILSPGVSTSQYVASVAHQQTGYQLYLWLFFVHCCCKSVTFPAVCCVLPSAGERGPLVSRGPGAAAVCRSSGQWSPVVTSGHTNIVTRSCGHGHRKSRTGRKWKTSLYVL